MKKFLIFFLLISYNSFSQCKEETRDDLWTDLIYIGCLNDLGNPDGKGKLIYKNDNNNIYYDGYFKDGEHHGEGTLYFFDGGKIWGTFEDGEFVKGNSYYESDGRIEKYEGGFKGNQFNYQGNGKLIKINNNKPTENVVIKKLEVDSGRFINDNLANGKREEVWSDGTEIISIIKFNIETLEPDVVSVIRNDRNYYNIDDIDGDVAFTEIVLEKKGNANEGISYLIPMKVSGTSTTIDGEWIFDTGAESFSIGKRMYERMKDEGMQFKDLNMEVQSIGVGGISNGELIVINEITIGDYKVKNVIAKVNLDHNFSLLGMWFLIKFKEVDWSMKNNKLKLYR
tara:strand:+ start:37 stop:1056 length:1020 start_codon:yes stop_codon:yes gene_type:complete